MTKLVAALPWFLAAIAPLLMYYRVYLKPLGKEAYFFGDTTGSYWPDLVYFVRALAHADLPLWNPDDRGGYPFAFDPQPGVLYPLNWAFAAVGLTLGRTPYSLFELKILVHLSLATVGWFAWLRRHVSEPAALVGSVAAGLGLYTIQNTHFGLIWPISWVPWALLGLDIWLTTRRIGPALAVGASIGAMFAAGSPPAALYGSFAIVGLGLPRVIVEVIKSRGQDRRCLLVSGLPGALVACCLAFPVVLGTSLLTQQSVLEKRSFDYFSSAPLWLNNLDALVVASKSHGFSLYAGVTVVVLAAIGTLLGATRLITYCAVLVGTFGLFMALGAQTPLAGWVYEHFPPIRYFRLIFRYLYLLQVGLAILAAVGTDELIASRRRGTLARALFTFMACCGGALLWAARSRAISVSVTPKEELPGFLTWIALVWGAAILAWLLRAKVLRFILLSGVVLVDLSLAVSNAGTLKVGVFSIPAQVSEARLAEIRKESSLYRVWDEFSLGYRSGSRLGIRDLRGYMDPLRLAHYETMAAHLSSAPTLLERWGVKWVLPAPHPFLGTSHNRVNEHKLTSARRLDTYVLELPEPRAPAVFTTRIEVPHSEGQLWAALEKNPLGAPLQLPPGFQATASDVSLASEDRANAPSADRPAHLVERRANFLSFLVDAPTDGWLVVNEAYFPGWIARVDGNQTTVFRADGWVRGMRIPRGVHHIEMAFRPVAWLVAAASAVGIWLGLAVLAARRTLRRINKPPNPL